ncbi:MAG: dioxygenase [Burkholderiaceae bacterium]
MTRLPSLYISHGAPTLALDPGEVGPALHRFAASLPRPRAVLVVSPHWSTAQPVLSTADRPPTIHDFHGFPRALYEIDYPCPGAPDVARQALDLLRAAGLQAGTDAGRGLDHGAWVPLRFMYPQADMPVCQLSLQPQRDPATQFQIGRALAPLADDGVLIVGSGSLTHNLHEFDRTRGDDEVEPYVTQFVSWIRERLQAGDLSALLDYRRQAPHAQRAHPTDEHLLPLFIAMGAADDFSRVTQAAGGIAYGILSMDAFALGGVA